MKAVNLFYYIKPIIPRRLQIAVRRGWASFKRKKNLATWPINPIASDVPINWRGWPEGKRFALVLIHDVESAIGITNSLKIMELERELGFVSSFNFVPQGYCLPEMIRREITSSGYEVGVHGLTHDGRQFRSHRAFRRVAPRINEYLKKWGAVGFSSPSMLSNLRWVADLDIEYSCSSFDTDPFEPRPYSVGTIFPFVVHNLKGDRSYVELPYTLPQDHSLFIMLKEQDTAIWEKKLDWIAKRGGMVLLNSHPDYVRLDGKKPLLEEYPVDRYADFLRMIAHRYSSQYWNALPRDVARYWRSSFTTDAVYRFQGTEVAASTRVGIYTHSTKYTLKIKLALTCAPGGHFEQMQNLSELYRNYPHFWITGRNPQTQYSLVDENRHFIGTAHFKKPWTYMAQFPRVFQILRKERPTHILSTGSGIIVLVPFLLSRLFGITFIHIETFSHVNHLTKMGRLLKWLKHPILTQWEGLKGKGIHNIGPVLSRSYQERCDKPAEELVFVTLGTRTQAFPRIVEAVESLLQENFIKERVIIQRGFTDCPTKLAETFDFRSPDQVDELIASSKYVVTQESAGIVTKCLKMNKRFIVMPRDYKHKELPAKSDMNEDLHYKLAELGFTYVVHDKEQLRDAINRLDQLKIGFRFDNSRAVTLLRKMIENK